MIKPGMPAVRVVVISPITPNWEMSNTPSGKPMADASMVSFRLNLVWPWLFMRLPTLRFPKAVNR